MGTDAPQSLGAGKPLGQEPFQLDFSGCVNHQQKVHLNKNFPLGQKRGIDDDGLALFLSGAGNFLFQNGQKRRMNDAVEAGKRPLIRKNFRPQNLAVDLTFG